MASGGSCNVLLFFGKTVGNLLNLLFVIACDGGVAELKGMSGVFVSPFFPNPYPDNSHCSWRIAVPKGYRVRLSFAAFELESTRQCRYDAVTVRDGASFSSPLLHRFCGARPPPVLSTGRNLLVTFVSDGETSLTGFRAGFEATPVRSELIRYFFSAAYRQ